MCTLNFVDFIILNKTVVLVTVRLIMIFGP